MSLAALIRGASKRDSADVATVTVATPATDDPTIRPSVASVATVTVAIPAKHESASASLWLLHFPDLDPVAVAFAPAVDHAGALASYPTALAAEPMPQRQAVPIPGDLSALFDACAQAGLYGDDDRAALPAMFALDAEGTRQLIEAMFLAHRALPALLRAMTVAAGGPDSRAGGAGGVWGFKSSRPKAGHRIAASETLIP